MQLKMDHPNGEVLRVNLEGRVVHGELNSESEPLQNLLGPVIYSRQVLLNMDAVTYIDSLGVGWLLKCHKRFREGGGKLIIHSVPPLAMQVLRVLQLERVLNLAESETLAAAQLAGATP